MDGKDKQITICMLKEQYSEMVKDYHEERSLYGKTARVDDMEVELYEIEDKLRKLGVVI